MSRFSPVHLGCGGCEAFVQMFWPPFGDMASFRTSVARQCAVGIIRMSVLDMLVTKLTRCLLLLHATYPFPWCSLPSPVSPLCAFVCEWVCPTLYVRLFVHGVLLLVRYCRGGVGGGVGLLPRASHAVCSYTVTWGETIFSVQGQVIIASGKARVSACMVQADVTCSRRQLIVLVGGGAWVVVLLCERLVYMVIQHALDIHHRDHSTLKLSIFCTICIIIMSSMLTWDVVGNIYGNVDGGGGHRLGSE